MGHHDSNIKKVDPVQAKLKHSKDHRRIMSKLQPEARSCKSTCLLPTTCCLVICFSIFYVVLQSTSSCTSSNPEYSHSQFLSSSFSYPKLLQMFQDNVISKKNSDSHTEEKCKGRRIFMYEVPAQFNDELARECTIAGRGPCAETWGCLYCGGLENEGKGMQIPEPSSNTSMEAQNLTIISQNGYNYNYSIRLRPPKAWYRTHQFSLEVVFHAKMKKYECLTENWAMADAFYVPYYAGQDLAVSIRCNALQIRDRRVNRLIGWLTGQEAWVHTRGKRHFLVLGRQPYDLNRTAMAGGWGLPVMTQPELANVTYLLWERDFSPAFHELGVPYPTSFHPSSDHDLRLWQETIKGARREWLVSYLGSARRKFRNPAMLLFRQELKRQCEVELSKCRFMDCTLQYTRWQIPCENQPEIVTLEFSNAVFCLQPEGDTPTRKSIFDSMLAGCIPVVFSNFTAHFQYPHFLPQDPSLYSIYLNPHDIAHNKTNFVHELMAIPQERIRLMQDTIREEIVPHIIYSMPNSSYTPQDAMDIALQQLFSNFTSSI